MSNGGDIQVPEGWVVKKLGEVSNVTMGQSPPSSTYNSSKDGLPFYQGTADFGNIYPITRYWCNEPSKIAKKGSVLFSVRAPVGDVNLASVKCCIGRGLSAIIGKDSDTSFLYQYIQHKKSGFQLLSQGSTFEAINGTELKQFIIITPPLPEQKKIASILTSVDDVIEKTEAQISKLQDLKKGMVTELLTKGIGHTEFKDSPVGRIPFSWGVKKIDELFSERRDSTNDTEKYPLCSLTIESGLIRKTDRYERSFLLTDKEAENYKVVFPEDIILNPMNLRWGAISKSDEVNPVTVSKYYNIIYTRSKETSSVFYGALFQSDKYIRIYDAISTGTLVEKRRVHLSQFIELYAPYPAPEEQKMIANIIKAADDKITIKQLKLTHTKSLKKALMNDLLTGKKRVNVNN